MMPPFTLTNTNNFTPVSDCIATNGSLFPLSAQYDFSNLTGFTLLNAGAASFLGVSAGQLIISCNSTNTRIDDVAHNAPGVRLDSQLRGDFDAEIQLVSTNQDANYEGACITFREDDTHFVSLQLRRSGGVSLIRLIGTGGGPTEDDGALFNNSSAFFKLRRRGDDFYGFFKEDIEDPWTSVTINLSGISAIGTIDVSSFTENTAGNQVAVFDNLWVYGNPMIFGAHDAADTKIDPGVNQAIDMSAWSKAHADGSSDMAYDSDNDSGHTPAYSAYIPFGDLASETDPTTRYFWARMRHVITGERWLETRITATTPTGKERFGISCAIDGNLMAVGAPGTDVGWNKPGSVYVRERTGDLENWGSPVKVVPDDTENNDQFGWALDVDDANDRLVVSALLKDYNGTANVGAVYVFTRTAPGTWIQQQKISPTARQDENMRYGASVKIARDAGTRIVVGVYGDDLTDVAGKNWAGTVRILDLSGGEWTETQRITADPDEEAEAKFGYAVDISDDGLTIAVGAYLEDSVSDREGAVYIFDDDGGFTLTEKLLADDAVANDRLGVSVAIDRSTGTRVVAGAYFKDSLAGAAYVFENDGGWSQAAKIESCDRLVGEADIFGASVAIDGDVILVGEPFNEGNKGSVYFFLLSGGTWYPECRESPGGHVTDEFGWSVAFNKHTGVVGAHLDDHPGDAGSAYIYRSNGFDELAGNSVTIDDTPPTAATEGSAYYVSHNSLRDVAFRLTTGNDVGGAGSSGYKKTTYRYHNTTGDIWYDLDADGTWAAHTGTEDPDDLHGVSFDGSDTRLVVGFAELPVTADQVKAVTWDIAENSTDGSAVDILPADIPEPTLTVADNQDGTGAVATIANSGGGSNTVKVIGVTGGWTTGGTRDGDGDVALSLAVGVYWAVVETVGPGGAGLSSVILFFVTDQSVALDRSDFGDEVLAMERVAVAELEQTVTYRRGNNALSISAVRGPVLTKYDNETGIDVALGDGSWSFFIDNLDFGAGIFEPELHDQVVTADGETSSVIDPGRMDQERIRRSVPIRREDYQV